MAQPRQRTRTRRDFARFEEGSEVGRVDHDPAPLPFAPESVMRQALLAPLVDECEGHALPLGDLLRRELHG
jgi:hypothetical protein